MNRTTADSSVEQDLPQRDSARSTGRVRNRETAPSPQARPKRSRTLVGVSTSEVGGSSSDLSLPDRCLLIQDEVYYGQCAKLYRVLACTKFDANCSKRNDYPCLDKPAIIRLMPCIPLRKILCYELRHMSPECDWGARSVPVLSCNLIKYFLGVAHQFTTLGLEVQATAFSYGNDGAVSYLAFLPQINTVSQVRSPIEMVAGQSMMQFSTLLNAAENSQTISVSDAGFTLTPRIKPSCQAWICARCIT